MDLYIAGFWILLLALTASAWFLRDREVQGWSVGLQPQLTVAAMFWIAATLTALLRPTLAARFITTEHALLLVDFGLFVGLAWVGTRSGQGWVLCAAALQLISASAHVARVVTPGMWRLGYQVMEEASSYPVLILLAWGVAKPRIDRARDRRSRTSFAGRPPVRIRRL